jgi:phosphohistidine swiveling domain-containing protein
MDEWQSFRARHIPTIWPIWTYFSWDLRSYLGVSKGTAVNIWKHGDFVATRKKSDLEVLGNATADYLLDNKDRLGEIRNEGILAGQKTVDLAKEFAGRAQDASLGDFKNFMLEFEQAYHELMRKNMILWLYSGDCLHARIKSALVGMDEKLAEETIAKYSAPEEETYSARQERELAKLLELSRVKGIGSQETRDAIKTFSDRYAWFPYEYVGPTVWDEQQVLKRVEESLALEVTRGEQRASANLDNTDLDVHVKDTLRVLRTVALMQDDRKMFLSQACYYLDRVVLAELSKKIGTSLELIRYIDPVLLDRTTHGEDITPILREREEFLIITSNDEETQFLVGSQAKAWMQEQGIKAFNDSSGVRELRGRVAMRGKAKGVARILLNSSAGQEFNEGDILITGMTTPDFIGYIKKAGAIVTNEGGVTCHAAIISRELGKPCVIGTQVATKVYQTGDMVEVDADKGVVRKIG